MSIQGSHKGRGPRRAQASAELRPVPPDRPDGRHALTARFVRHLLRQTPRLAFDPRMSAGESERWRRDVRRRLRSLLAFPRVPRQPAPQRIEKAARDGYRLERWELYPEPGSVVPFLLLIPDGASAARPVPLVLCFPGSDHPKEFLCGEPWEGPGATPFGERQFMARQFAQAGFAALAMDNPGTCSLFDPSQPHWTRQAEHLLWLGRSYEGLSTFQKRAALHWARGLPFVDRQRVAVCGHSLGAKPALHLGLLDPGVSAVIWNGHASDDRERTLALNLEPMAPWHHIPGFARWFDNVDLQCALAPTPLLVTEGGHTKDLAKIRQAYRLADAAGRFRVAYMPGFTRAAERCRRRMPEEGLTIEEYRRYGNFGTEHYFKGEVALPWLGRLFGVPLPDGSDGGGPIQDLGSGRT